MTHPPPSSGPPYGTCQGFFGTNIDPRDPRALAVPSLNLQCDAEVPVARFGWCQCSDGARIMGGEHTRATCDDVCQNVPPDVISKLPPIKGSASEKKKFIKEEVKMIKLGVGVALIGLGFGLLVFAELDRHSRVDKVADLQKLVRATRVRPV